MTVRVHVKSGGIEVRTNHNGNFDVITSPGLMVIREVPGVDPADEERRVLLGRLREIHSQIGTAIAHYETKQV